MLQRIPGVCACSNGVRKSPLTRGGFVLPFTWWPVRPATAPETPATLTLSRILARAPRATGAACRPCQHPARGVKTPPRLPALYVDFHAVERLGKGCGSPHQHWPRAGSKIHFQILHFPSDPFKCEGEHTV